MSRPFPARPHSTRLLAIAFLVAAPAGAPHADPTVSPTGEATGVFREALDAPQAAPLTGAFVHTIPFRVPAARGRVSPELSLVYGSSAGDGEAGYGWSLALASVERSPLSGWPAYDDTRDRFTYGGSPLVFVCVVGRRECGNDPLPSWASGSRYYRQQVEGSFARFFLSPDGRTWRIQQKGGTVIELGRPVTHAGLAPEAVDRERATAGAGPIFRWRPVRQVDLHGNVVIYVWHALGADGLTYLTDVYDTAPAALPISLDRFAHHTQLLWELHGFRTMHNAHVDRARPDFRLKRVTVASMDWEAKGERTIVRLYRLSYYHQRTGSEYDEKLDAPLFHHSFLRSVRMEGDCGTREVHGQPSQRAECESTALPETTFQYEPANITGGVSGTSTIFGAPPDAELKGEILPEVNSASIVDLNHDGFPDVVETWRGGDVIEPNNFPEQRQHIGYLSKGYELNSLRFVHQCIDAGTGVPGSLAFHNLLQGAAFLTGGYGASVVGSWADALVLWSKTHYGPVGVEAVPANPAFCPLAATDPAHGAWRWVPSSRAPWLKEGALSGTNAPSTTWFTDVDGDGWADALNPKRGAPGVDLEESGVLFTRQFPPGHPRGPAVLPFSEFVSAPGGLAPASRARSDTRFFYVDVDGDGILDLVTANPGDGGGVPRVRFGDGRGGFACRNGAQPEPCSIPADPAHPWMTPAAEIVVPDRRKPWPFTDETWLHDITGDGLADIVQIANVNGFTSVLLWTNEDGRTFRCAAPESDCVIAVLFDDLRGRPDISPRRVTFADMDANGTDDVVVLGNAGVWYASAYDPNVRIARDVPRPGLLTRIDNGSGATTLIAYKTIQELDRAATGKQAWTTHVPTVVPVVIAIAVVDTPSADAKSTALPAPYGIRRLIHYGYRDPAYDPWRRAFLGFRSVSVRVGDDRAVTETTSWFGPCQGDLAACRGGSDADPTESLAVTGLPVRIDRYSEGYGNEEGRLKWLSSIRFEYLTRALFRSSAGTVWSAYPYKVRTSLYDPDQPVKPGARSVPVTGGDPVEESPTQPGGAVITRITGLDERGNLIWTERDGRGSPADRPVQTTATFQCNADWVCMPQEVATSWVPSGGVTPPERHIRFSYSPPPAPPGDLIRIEALLSDSEPLMRFHETPGASIAPPPPTASVAGWKLLARFDYDALGNVVATEGGGTPSSCTTIQYDAQYAQLPEVTRAHAGGCTAPSLDVVASFSRGFDAPVRTTAPDGSVTELKLDGFGRPIELDRPAPDAPLGTSVTATRWTYHDAAPLSWIKTETVPSPSGPPLTSFIVLDGLGEMVLAFEQADAGAGDGGPWVGTDWVERGAGGAVSRRYRPWFLSPSQNPETLAGLAALTPPVGTGTIEYTRDDFGRVASIFADGEIQQQLRYRVLGLDVFDARQAPVAGHLGPLYASLDLDGLGNVSRTTRRLPGDEIIMDVERLATGEPIRVTQRHTAGPDRIVREMAYDSLGRLVRNVEPNTAQPGSGTAPVRAWRYAYDDAGRLVGTSDARGCGENLAYDSFGRLASEDYSPCVASQPAYSALDATTSAGAEVLYRYDAYESGQVRAEPGFADAPELALGHLVSIRDRGALTLMNYDARGRVRRVAREIASPSGGLTYAAHRYAKRLDYDLADRLVRATTGADVPQLLAGGESSESFTYSGRGLLASIGSSHGTLVQAMVHDADGSPLSVVYGDVAKTTATLSYDRHRWLKGYRLQRYPQPLWGAATPTYSVPTAETTETNLADVQIDRDEIGNPLKIADVFGAGWPVDAVAAERTLTWDALSRLTHVVYGYPGGGPQVPPFDAEVKANDTSPVPLRAIAARVADQTFTYEWTGNTIASSDDQNLFFDRSVGSVVNGGAVGPNQLRSGNGISATYDAAGEMTDLTVVRTGTCPSGSGSACVQRYAYDWDEVGQLARVRRWDYALPSTDPPPPARPPTPPAWDLTFAYSQGERIRKTERAGNAPAVHTLDVFDSLRLEKVAYDSRAADYVRDPTRVSAYFSAARVVYAPGLPSPTGEDSHVCLVLPDILGSTALVLDRATGEVMERVSFLPYGAVESDFRPERWHAYREVLRFTGKEEDVESGLLYFGGRYFHPRLGRWISTDPLAIHLGASDPNPYAYVGGRVLTRTDPDGLGPPPECPEGATCFGSAAGLPDDVITVPRPDATDRMRSPAPRRDTPPPAPGRVVTRTTDALLNAASWAFRQWKRNAENTIIEAADVVMGLVGGGNLGDEARDVGKYRETSYLTTAINAALLVSPPGTRTAALEGRSVLTIATPELPLGSTAGAAQRGALEPGRLAAIGPQTWESSAGLIYAPGSQHGNRVRHVLTHAAPDPSKMMHNVFAGGTKAVLPVIDEAWIMRGSPVPGDPGAFIVPMGRVVGTAGETSIKIVVRPGTEYIITAYPVFP